MSSATTLDSVSTLHTLYYYIKVDGVQDLARAARMLKTRIETLLSRNPNKFVMYNGMMRP